MSEDAPLVDEPVAPPPRSVRGSSLHRAGRWIAAALLALLLLVAAALAWLHTSSGRAFVVGQIAKAAPASGLTIEVGRIEGSVLWNATLYDVKLRDADKALFLEVPQVDLNWRPLRFFWSGLDVRHLVLSKGTLYRVPRLNPGDPDAPTLPDFDIRVDRFVVDDLKVAKGLLGDERVIDFRASARVRKGLVRLDSEGDLDGGDVFKALVLAEPDGDRFDLDLDYRAPAGGLLAKLTGTDEALRARLMGEGTWTKWDGQFNASRAGRPLASVKVLNRAGTYSLDGQVHPDRYVAGLTARALGPAVTLKGSGTLVDSVLAGKLDLAGRGIASVAEGKVDLAQNRFDAVVLKARLLDRALFGPGVTLDGTTLDATLDGPFSGFSAPHRLSIARLDANGTVLTGLVQQGTLRFADGRATVPLDATVARVVSGNKMIDPRLVNGRLGGTLTYSGNRLTSPDLALAFPGLSARLALAGDFDKGAWGLSGPVRASGLPLENVGTMDADGTIQLRVGSNYPWQLDASFAGTLPRVTNATLANVAGSNIRFRGGVSLGSNRPVVFRRTSVTASKLMLTLDGRIEAGRTTVIGEGRHVDYGPFTAEAEVTGEGPRAALVFANPYPAAGLRDVHVALAPEGDGFVIDTEGQSTLGPFAGKLGLVAPATGPTRIDVRSFTVANTAISGGLALEGGVVNGALRLSGGGVEGAVTLAGRQGGQGFDVLLDAKDARFTGMTALNIGEGHLEARGLLGADTWTVNGELTAAGIGYGALFIGRAQARAEVTDGTGTFDAQLAGSRGSQFDLLLTGDASPDQVRLAARGSYGGQAIVMPRRAILARTEDGGWQLSPTQLNFGGGAMMAEGRIGGEEAMSGKLHLSGMPLSLADALGGDLGLGGTASGIVEFGQGPGGLPVGEARVMVSRLARSGLVLSSRPIDLALVGRLEELKLQVRAVAKESGTTRGRLQGTITQMPLAGTLTERLYAGKLDAQVRFSGPADALWRLAALELFDLTGELAVAADIGGTLTAPELRGSLAGDSLRVQSALTGTDLRNVRARGQFDGSRLYLTSFAGTASNGGAVSGSGTIGLAGVSASQGPTIDLRVALRDAQVMDLSNMGATVTGPMRVVSDGNGGTIAARLTVQGARWVLGASTAATRLPTIATREINLPPDRAPARAAGRPWRYLIDAHAPGGVAVTGMGLDSEWAADIRLRGTTEDPRIGGEARIVPRQGFYTFAGTRFEITRGTIDFDASGPPDPRINLVAEADVQDLSVAVSVTGQSSKPAITFTSNPALPEEELLTRLLFGDSITNLSATDALQLGAALASLRGGGGLDPINQLRTAIGLDRLRIVPADAALDRGTSIALGKNFGRRFYVEIVTDGRGYSATELEFRVTGWLSLLASVDTLGRGSVAGAFSRDY